MKAEYHYLTENGVLKGFDKSYPSKNKRTYLTLDSSVCLDIINIVNKKTINKDSKRKVFELIKYSQKKAMPIFEIFALLELSINKENYLINIDKMIDFSNKLMFAFKLPLEKLKKNDFTFTIINKEPTITDNDASIFVEQLMIHYCALLKIREISCNGLGKLKAKNNIFEFIKWMDNEIGLFLGLEYQLAFQIFGGETNFNSMIKEKFKKRKSIKNSLGNCLGFISRKIKQKLKTTI